jgi:hypothetical protein
MNTPEGNDFLDALAEMEPRLPAQPKEPTMKYVIRAIAIILTSPIWLAGIALALPVVIFGIYIH